MQFRVPKTRRNVSNVSNLSNYDHSFFFKKSKEKIIKSKFDMPLKRRANFLLSLKWVNIEWKQVAADRHELQSITNF